MSEKINGGVTDSEFYMWRAVFAFSRLDNTISPEEQKILQPFTNSILFSQAQNDILKNDFQKPQDVEALYRKITDPKDKERFCVLARALAWCDGDMDKQEEAILKKVSCLSIAGCSDDDVLVRTRRHPHLDGYYLRYSKEGVAALFRLPQTDTGHG